MTENDKLQMFEDQPIRTAWDEAQEEWYFSVVDVVAALTEQTEARKASTYWTVLKKRLRDEGADELLTNCKQLKMRSPKDGKRYKTDVATTEQLLRIIQSIPSKKAEPFKMWLAMVGRERIEEIIDPELTIERALDMLAEATTTELTNTQNPNGLEENRAVAQQGGKVAGNARKEIESQTGRPVVTSGNAQTMLLGNAVVGMIESVAEENEKE